jgi:hypothetical protein
MPRGTQLGNEFITEDEVDDLFGGDLDFDDDGAGGGSGGGEREGEKAEDDVEMEIGATQMPNGTNNVCLLHLASYIWLMTFCPVPTSF